MRSSILVHAAEKVTVEEKQHDGLTWVVLIVDNQFEITLFHWTRARLLEALSNENND